MKKASPWRKGNNPGSIDLASRDEIDLFINIGTDAAAHFPIDAVKKLKKHTWITINPNVSMAAEIAVLHIPVGISGVEVPGIVYRMDNVPIQYRKVIDMPEGMLSDEEVLTGIANRLEELILEKAKICSLDSSEPISLDSVICT